MQKFKSILFFLFLGISLNAQDSFEPTNKNILGIGASEFINSVFSSDKSAYSIEYRRYFSNYNYAFRVGTNYNFNNSETGNTEFGIKLGVDKNLSRYKMWEFYYGLDFNVNYAHYKSSDKASYKYSASPFLGIMLRLGQNFSLVTEPAFMIEYNKLVDGKTFATDNDESYVEARLSKIGYLQLNFHF